MPEMGSSENRVSSINKIIYNISMYRHIYIYVEYESFDDDHI